MTRGVQRSSMVRLLVLLVRSGWFGGLWLLTTVPPLVVALAAGIEISLVAGLLLAIGVAAIAGLLAAALAAWRAAQSVHHPPARNEMPPPPRVNEQTEQAPEMSVRGYSTYRNPMAASRVRFGVHLPVSCSGYDVESSDGSFDHFLATGTPVRSMRPMDVGRPNRDIPLITTARRCADSLPPSEVIWLIPSARYHVKELGPLGAELSAAGVPWHFICLSAPGGGLVNEMSRWTNEFYVVDGLDALRKTRPRAIVLMNDWGPHSQLVLTARALSTVTFAKVEGAQDFANRDTLRRTLPYRNADYIMCHGNYDKSSVGTRGVIVGSCRLEALISLADQSLKERSRDRYAVANYNFSYGTREYAARGWLGSVRDACRAANVELAVSVHPAVLAPEPFRTCEFPLAFELERAGCFITRCSTALFDAAALGTPVAYFNPHAEKCWIDLEFGSAVPRLRNHVQLVEWLREAGSTAESTESQRAWLTHHYLSMQEAPCERRMAELVISASA
jgi:hypothetical protein